MINEIEKDLTGLQRVHTDCVMSSSDWENTKKKPWSLGSGTWTSSYGQYKPMVLSEAWIGHIKKYLYNFLFKMN